MSKTACTGFFCEGFTLIELLVAISIMAVVGIVALSNYGSGFKNDKRLKNATLDVQTFLRLAQTNATSSLKCASSTPSTGWIVEFTNGSNLSLKCQYSSGTTSIKTLSLSSYSTVAMTFANVAGSNCVGKIVTFAPLYGTMTTDCGSPPLTITLTDSNDSSHPKTLKVDSGGRIYEP